MAMHTCAHVPTHHMYTHMYTMSTHRKMLKTNEQTNKELANIFNHEPVL